MSKQQTILVLDHQDYWRDFSSQALQEAGFSVSVQDTDSYICPASEFGDEPLDLVILGCTRVGPREERLISQFIQHKHHLLVLCSVLPWQMMRALFRQGVDDVVDKPFNPNGLVAVVNDALNTIASHLE